MSDTGTGGGDGEQNRRIHLDPVLDSAPRRGASDLDYEADPLLRLERNNSSTRQAIVFALAVPPLTFLTAFVIAMISRAHGGPLCDAGTSIWICSRTYEILFPVIPGLVTLGGTFGAAYITYRRWARYERWRPWLAALWPLMLFSLAWITGVGTMAVIGSS
ncbi:MULTISPECIES: hypothetical protein [unclassified Corynebacterium]|uniref:hypothetical protein n=1 Tax=unclassified Corynebacterium TaxID=2624378 RepID=UPI0035268349